MIIKYYTTVGGKNLILEELNHLEISKRAEAYYILNLIEDHGIEALNTLNTRKIYQKVYELKFGQSRIFYLLMDKEHIYRLHMCKKQKQKTEQNDKMLAIKRSKELGRKRG